VLTWPTIGPSEAELVLAVEAGVVLELAAFELEAPEASAVFESPLLLPPLPGEHPARAMIPARLRANRVEDTKRRETRMENLIKEKIGSCAAARRHQSPKDTALFSAGQQEEAVHVQCA
jgi:hypothetical protein